MTMETKISGYAEMGGNAAAARQPAKTVQPSCLGETPSGIAFIAISGDLVLSKLTAGSRNSNRMEED
jgi:hypothetical protein